MVNKITQFTEDVEVIQKLGDHPNSDDGISADELKAKFDQAGSAIKKYLNEQIVPAVQKLQEDADNSATFTPAVDTDGNLSWTNDNGLPNPEPVNIKGPKGDTGEKGDLASVNFTDDGSGNVTIGTSGRMEVTLTDDGDGNVRLEVV
jgi:hypothetical protein